MTPTSFLKGRLLGLASLSLGLAAGASVVACGSSKNSPAPVTTNAGGEGGASSGSGGADGGADSGVAKAVSLNDLVESMGGPAKKSDWTVFVYGHADHNLSFSLVRDMKEMQAAKLEGAGNVKVIVLADFDSSQVEDDDADPPKHYPSGTEIYSIPGEGRPPELIAVDEELDLDDPAQLQRVTSIVFSAFPADRHGLVMWDHGGSWSAGFGADSQNGTRSPAPGMPAEKIPPAIAQGLTAAGIASEPPLDLFTFDTCLMNGAEVSYPFRKLAPIYIANAEIDYGDGWDYTTTLSYLAAMPSVEATTLAKAEVSHWDKHHEQSSLSDITLRAHAALETSKLDALAGAMSKLSNALLETDGFNIADLARIAYNSAPIYMSTFEEGSSSPGLHDLGQVLDGLAASELVPTAVATAASEARAALGDAILANSLGEIRKARKQAGFHIELSRGADLTEEKLASYGKLASQWAEASGWKKVLDAMAQHADSTAPHVERDLTNADAAGPGALPVITFSSTDADVQNARVLLAVHEADGTLTFRGLLGAGIVEPNASYEFAWDGQGMTVGGTPAMMVPWIDVGDDPDNTVLQVPGVITETDGTVTEVTLVFGNNDESATTFISKYEEMSSTHTLDEIVSTDPGATFTPRLLSLNPDTKESQLVLGKPVPIPASAELPLALEPVPAGDYVLVTQIDDVWGNRTVAQDPIKLVQPVTP